MLQLAYRLTALLHCSLQDDDYELAMKRVRDLLDVDPDVECTKPQSNDVLWSVVSAFLK